jgi:outer membrane protein assembly factor BamB
LAVKVFAFIGVLGAGAGFVGGAGSEDSARQILDAAGVRGGLVVHLGCGDGQLTAALHASASYLVHGLDVSPLNVDKARDYIRSKGLYGPVSAARWTDPARLPYADNFVNLVVAEDPGKTPMAEVMRVLAPLGVAYVKGADGRWTKTVKPWPKEIDQWTHFLHAADGNAVAADTKVGPPGCLQWMGEPRWTRSHEELSSISAVVSANGRMFTIVDEGELASLRYPAEWTLTAADAFNGTPLWKRPIGVWTDHLRHFRAGPTHLPRRLVAVGDEVYVTLGLGAPVAALDAATGKTLRTYPGTEATEEILCDNGVLYLVVGTSEVRQTGGGLSRRGEPAPTAFRFAAAFEAASAKPLWKKQPPKDEFILPLSLAVGGGRVFYQTTKGVVCLEAKSGAEQWKTPRATPASRYAWSAPTMVVRDGVLLLADRGAGGKQGEEAPAAQGGILWGVDGWNVAGMARTGRNTLVAYAADTGKELWSAECKEGYNSPVDVFVARGLVWAGGSLAQGRDLRTGQVRKEVPNKPDPVGMAHHRCYREKATEQYILTGRSGVEFLSLDAGWVCNNSWVRGDCQYGILPCNGLLYAPSNSCACFSKAKLQGFVALATPRPNVGWAAQTGGNVLEKGPAYGQGGAAGAAEAAPWPAYRHDVRRSGAAAVAAPASLNTVWSVPVGGRLTQPIVAAGKVFVASTDAHAVFALAADTGREAWHYTAGGRIDSAPTYDKGVLYFGSADGWVYAVRAADGVLAWRLQAAPEERFVGVYGQLESAWPVHGAVLIQNGELYATAGRSSYIDGGIALLRINPATGQVLSRTSIYDRNPATGRQTAGESHFDMEGTLSDVLVGDGYSVFMKHLRFDRYGKEMKDPSPHLFSPTGLLGEEWFVRSYWLVNSRVGTGWGNWAQAAGQSPAGRILCFADDRYFGYGREKVASGPAGHKLDTYQLFAQTSGPKTAAPGAKDAAKGKAKAAGQGGREYAWTEPFPVTVRAMVLASDRLVVAGVPDLGEKASDGLWFKNPTEALDAFEGRKGAVVCLVSAADGKTQARRPLDGPPVFDGMSAADGRVLISLKNGTVICLGGR